MSEATPQPESTRLELIPLAHGARRGRRDVSRNHATQAIYHFRELGDVLLCRHVATRRTTRQGREDGLGRFTVLKRHWRDRALHNGVPKPRTRMHGWRIATLPGARKGQEHRPRRGFP